MCSQLEKMLQENRYDRKGDVSTTTLSRSKKLEDTVSVAKAFGKGDETALFLMKGAPDIKENRNISLILMFTFISFTSRTLWIQSVLISYIYLISSHNDITVGFLTSIVGIAQLCISFPTGYLSDISGQRHVIIRIGSICGSVSAVLFLYAISKKSSLFLSLALCFFGCYWGMVQTAVLALFTDSIPSGLTTKYFTQRLLVTRCGVAMGPFSSLIIFLCIGNRWTISQCSWVLILSQLLSLPGLILPWYLNDDNITQASTTGSIQDQDESSKIQIMREEGNNETRRILNSSYKSNIYGASSVLSLNTCPSNQLSGKKATEIARTIAACDLISNLANGISIRFFPVFFMDKLSMNPSGIQILYFCNPILGIGMASLAHHLSIKSNRCLVSIILELIGIFFFSSFILFYQYTHALHGDAPSMTSRVFICVLFVLRTIFLNSTQALTKSIMMDVVPKEERGRWSSFESINNATWAGSAFLGGILCHRFGFAVNFYTCIVLHLVRTLILSTIINEIPVDIC